MDLEPYEQENLYKNYWVYIENLTGDIAEFIRNYLSFKLKVLVRKYEVYAVFKPFSIQFFGKDKEGILKDLLYFGKIYSYLVQINEHPNKDINNLLARLHRLELTISHPYLLDVLNDLEDNILSEDNVKEILILIESYAFRKIFVYNSTAGLNKLFVIISKEIKQKRSKSRT